MHVYDQGDVEQKKYTNIRNTAHVLIGEYGIVAGLFKGLREITITSTHITHIFLCIGLMWRITLISTTFFLVNKWKQVIIALGIYYELNINVFRHLQNCI